ncbi:MAG: hypothetical protein KF724_04555 [Phycisphaeraceae bacterium]|nr:hypothetical protein [Phycisphaeraceae bacterium]
METTAVGLMRNLGRFVGHIAAGLRASPGATERHEVRRTIEESTRDDGVILRRTVIEEIEVRSGDTGGPAASNDPRAQ